MYYKQVQSHELKSVLARPKQMVLLKDGGELELFLDLRILNIYLTQQNLYKDPPTHFKMERGGVTTTKP
jgi:hypothetical protein